MKCGFFLLPGDKIQWFKYDDCSNICALIINKGLTEQAIKFTGRWPVRPWLDFGELSCRISTPSVANDARE